jgi:hypothetical protein
MANTDSNPITAFYNDLQTLPKLVGDLAISIAEGQRRLDQDYLENLASFCKIIAELQNQQPVSAQQFQDLFKAMGPSRYQFTETVMEVRADLQMTTLSQFSAGATIGITVPFAVSVNASYTSRNAYDYQASALIRTTINAIPSNDTLLSQLLPRAGDVIHADLPNADRYNALKDALFDNMNRTSGSPESGSPR